MNGTILNIAMLVMSIGLIVFVVKRKNLSYKADLGLVLPNRKNLIFWTTMFVVLLALEDYIYKQFNHTVTESWIGKYTTVQMLFRGIAIGILAPVTEELLFRGLLFWRIKNSRLNNVGAIIIPAILFAAIHIQYFELVTFGIIFIDGLFYGLARHFSKSVVLAIILHSLSNLGAVLERIL